METKNRLKDFQIQKKLGFGSYGVIFRVMRRSDSSILVLKQIDLKNLKEKMRKNAINQATLLSQLKSPFIVEYLESFIQDNKLNIIMQHCEGGDLSLYLKQQCGRPLKQDKVWEIMLQVILGLQYIHNKRILHRDIKTLNIFLSKEDRVKIGDLGVAKLLNQSVDFAQTMVGTPFYLSPELCQQKPYNQKSDIWALGCLIYEMCTYRHPFEAANQGSLILKIIRGKYNPIPNYSKQLRDIVTNCLERDYKRRPTAALLLSRIYCQQKIESFGLKVVMDRYVIQQEGKKKRQEGKVSVQIVKAVEQTPTREKEKQKENRLKEEEKKKKEIQLKRKQDEKRIREQAQKKEDVKKAQDKMEQAKRLQQKRKQEINKQEIKKQQLRKESQKRQEQLLKEQQKKDQMVRQQLVKKQQRKRQQLRKEELKRENEKRQQQKKEQLKREQIRKQQLRKEQSRREQLKREEEQKRKQIQKLQQIKKSSQFKLKQQPKTVEKLIQRTPVQKVKLQRQIAPRVYQKKSIDINRYISNKHRQDAKLQNKLFKPLIPPTVPVNLVNNMHQRNQSRKSVHSFEEKGMDRYQKKQIKKDINGSGNLPPRIRKGAPEGKARNALKPNHNITKEEQQMVLDLPDNPKDKLGEDGDSDFEDKMSSEKIVKSFILEKEVDHDNVLRKYERLMHSAGTEREQKERQDEEMNTETEKGQDGQSRFEKEKQQQQQQQQERHQQEQVQQQQQEQSHRSQLSQHSQQQQTIHLDPTNQYQTNPSAEQYDQYQQLYPQLQEVKVWSFDQSPQLPHFESQFQENDSCLMDDQPSLIIAESHSSLQAKLESNMRRQNQLNKLMQLKIDECKKAFKGNYDQVIQFFRKKINVSVC